jgi:hypothetical protein
MISELLNISFTEKEFELIYQLIEFNGFNEELLARFLIEVNKL